MHRPGSDTEVTGLCVIVDDVTAEEELARSLEETRARVEQITESMAAGYLVLDTSDERWPITYANTQAEVALGLTRRELLGASLWELFPATVGTAFEAGYRRALDGGGPFVFDAYYPPPLDAWYEVRAVPEGRPWRCTSSTSATGSRRSGPRRRRPSGPSCSPGSARS